MSIGKIESALVDGYVNGAFGLPTGYPNKNFSPKQGEPWAKVHFIPNQPSVGSLGTYGDDETDGIFQIDINYPLDQGNGDTNAKADQIRAHFKAGTSFSHNGQSVRVKSCGAGRGRSDGGWWRVPITVMWTARIARN